MACEVDWDCEAPLVCFKNMSWSTKSSFCGCSNWFGHVGPQCETFGTTSYILLVSGGTQFVYALYLWVMSLLDVSVVHHTGGFSMNASNTTLLAVSMGLMSFTGFKLFYNLQNVVPSSFTYLKASSGQRESTFLPATDWFLMGAQVLAVMSSLNVSMMWVELSYQSKQLTVRASTNVTTFRRACLAFAALFGMAMISATAAGRVELSPVLAIPFIFILAVTFLLGRIRMIGILEQAFLNTATPSVLQSEDVPNRQTSKRTREGMQAVKSCSTQVIAALFSTACFGVIYTAAVALPKNGWRDFNGNGEILWAGVLGEGVSWSMLWLLRAIFGYTHKALESRRSSRVQPDQRTQSSRERGPTTFTSEL